MLTGPLPTGLMLLFGIFTSRILLVRFGSEVNGVLSSISSIRNYLALLESGIGLAATQALYDTAGRGDRGATNRILTASGISYRKAAYGYLACLFGVAALYALVMETALSPAAVFGLFLLYSIPYFFTLRFQTVYTDYLWADGKSYVISEISMLFTLLTRLAELYLLLHCDNILLVVGAMTGIDLFRPAVIVLYMRRAYPWIDLHDPKPDFTRIKQKSAVLVHNIASIIFGNSDVFLLSLFTDFKVVSVYSVYQMVFVTVGELYNSMMQGARFIPGQLYHTDKEQFKRYVDFFETIYMMLGFALFTAVYLFILPFIRLYTTGVTDIAYMDSAAAMLFVVVSMLGIGKYSLDNILTVAGQFENTKHHAVWEMIINIAVSMLLIPKFSIRGALAGSVAALLYRHNRMAVFANRFVLKQSAWVSYKKLLLNFAVFVFAAWGLGRWMPAMTSYGTMILWCIPYAALLLALYGGVNFLFFRPAFRTLFRFMFQK